MTGLLSIGVNVDKRLPPADQRHLYSPGLSLVLRVRNGPLGYTGKQRILCKFQEALFPVSLVSIFLPRDWQLPPLPRKCLTVAMATVVIGNIGIGIVGVSTSKRVGARIVREVLQEDG